MDKVQISHTVSKIVKIHPQKEEHTILKQTLEKDGKRKINKGEIFVEIWWHM